LNTLEAEECEMQWKMERTEEKEMVGGGYCCCTQQTGVQYIEWLEATVL
jgi:hypothetical protein